MQGSDYLLMGCEVKDKSHEYTYYCKVKQKNIGYFKYYPKSDEISIKLNQAYMQHLPLFSEEFLKRLEQSGRYDENYEDKYSGA